MLRRFLLTGVVVLVTICGWAQQQVVSGTVFDTDTRKPLAGASITAGGLSVVTSSSGGDVKPIKGRDSFDQRDAFFDKVDYFRDPAFWQDYNIIEPTESLDEAVRKLLKGHR